MTNPLKLMEYTESIGHELSLEGEQLRIKRGNRLPEDLREQIKRNKLHIIEILKRDQAAKEAGFMIGLVGEIYTKTLGRNSIVYIEQIDGKWTAWRETYQKEKVRAISYKVIIIAETFDYALVKAKGYFDYIHQKRRSKV